jgi:hypothetical protein
MSVSSFYDIKWYGLVDDMLGAGLVLDREDGRSRISMIIQVNEADSRSAGRRWRT